MKPYFTELITEIKKKKLSKEKISKLKVKLCKKHKFRKIPTDIEVLLNAQDKDVLLLKKYLVTKPVRTGSGVAVVATMTKPFPCPHGSCSYCPGGPNSTFGDVPKSYTGHEPATMRGIRNKYDPYLQVFNRLEQYVVLGQNPDKVEQIIMGGTFPSYPKKYQEEFVYYSFKAMNDFSKLFYKKGIFQIKKFKEFFELPGKVNDKIRVSNIHNRLFKLKKQNLKSLEKEQILNEKSNIKCVGLTIETRPDYGFKKHGNEFLRLGCTRVELGVQTVYDDILKSIHRGHTIKDTIKSVRELKDLGFKLNFHMMPGLPGVSKERDIISLRTLFFSDDFKPDMLKIYPCMVMPGTKLYHDYKKGKYKPLDIKKAVDIISEFKKDVPKYCRIMRVQRDIPSYQTIAGVDRTNFRQYLEKTMRKKDYTCDCIRCKEIGDKKISGKISFEIIMYNASKGKEFFISLVNQNKLLGFCRLRFPSQKLRKEITKKSALIRELHVYGAAESIGKRGKIQHKGFGKKLMRKAEQITKQNEYNKLLVISGVGVRDYYKKLGYKKQGPYMIKKL
jgi:elongator complex protein 3